MKLLLDTCVWGPAVDELRRAGHDAEWVGTWEKDPGDRAILQHAHDHGQTVVTLDKDFGELAVLQRTPHSGIIRLVDLAPEEQAPCCLVALVRHGEDLQRGAIVTVDRKRVRFRPPPGDDR